MRSKINQIILYIEIYGLFFSFFKGKSLIFAEDKLHLDCARACCGL